MIRRWTIALALVGCRTAPPAPLDVPAAPPAVAPAAEPPPPAPVPQAPQAPQAPQEVELPARWASVPLEELGSLLEATFPAGEPRTLVPSAFEELSSALRGDDPLALRALLVLARCSDPLACELLLVRLERRASARGELGATLDIAAAAAVRGLPGSKNAASRLESLAYGQRPHPELEVRVECACSALALGRVKALPFLFAVLKHGTRLAVASSSWKPIPEMGLCQRRAAEALSERAGQACRFRPLQPLDERESEIRALEMLLAQRRP